jgi:hypothetical protein
MLWLKLIVIISGLLIIAFPRAAWKLKNGRQKDVQITKDSLLYVRIGGAIITLLGIFAPI